MKFSKEYINECDCPEIQGLRKKLVFGDIVFWRIGKGKKKIEVFGITLLDGKINIALKDEYVDIEGRSDDMVWLPTSGQLDEEIVKICKHNLWLYKVVYGLAEDEKEFGYDIEVYNADGLYWHDIAISYNTNPLIAKIKLLKQLLEEE